MTFQSLDDAVRIKRRLDDLAAGDSRSAAAADEGSRPPTVVIVGAGYSGVELASVVAERMGSRAEVKVRRRLLFGSCLGRALSMYLRWTSAHLLQPCNMLQTMQYASILLNGFNRPSLIM